MNKISEHQEISEEIEKLKAQVDLWLDKVSAELITYKDGSIRYKAELDDFSREIDEHKNLLEKQLSSISFFSKNIKLSDYVEPLAKLTK
jgi:peptidoglycan hydrolase CwlO-like protein